MGRGFGRVGMDHERAFSLMVRIRCFEEAQRNLWLQGRIPGELHTGIGEEAIVAGVVMHLTDGDATVIDHRSTGPLIALGADPQGLLLEVLGSEHGVSGGLAGHMHLLVPELLATSDGIVGSSGPVAAGFALAAKRLRPGGVAVAFFGEGAANQGMLLESFNLAVAWNLPVLFVCKDNGWAITTPTSQVTGGDLVARARGFGLPADRVEGWRVDEVYRAARTHLARARRGDGPGFLVARCQRPDGHFAGDPMLRILHEPVEQARQLAGPLARAAGAKTGGRLRDRGRAAAGLGGRLAMLGLQRGLRRRDPLVDGRRHLASAVAAEIETRVQAEVDAAVSCALERAAPDVQSDEEVRA